MIKETSFRHFSWNSLKNSCRTAGLEFPDQRLWCWTSTPARYFAPSLLPPSFSTPTSPLTASRNQAATTNIIGIQIKVDHPSAETFYDIIDANAHFIFDKLETALASYSEDLQKEVEELEPVTHRPPPTPYFVNQFFFLLKSKSKLNSCKLFINQNKIKNHILKIDLKSFIN